MQGTLSLTSTTTDSFFRSSSLVIILFYVNLRVYCKTVKMVYGLLTHDLLVLCPVRV